MLNFEDFLYFSVLKHLDLSIIIKCFEDLYTVVHAACGVLENQSVIVLMSQNDPKITNFVKYIYSIYRKQ